MFLNVKKVTIYNLRLVVFIGEGYAAWFAFYALCGVFYPFILGFSNFHLVFFKKQIPKFGGKPYILLFCKEIA